MFLEKKTNELIDNKKTVNVTLIGAGKFGSMFLSQAPHTKGLNVFTICDLNIDKAKKACREVGWNEDQINNIIFTEDFEKAINNDEVDVVVEATGHPSSGINCFFKIFSKYNIVNLIFAPANFTTSFFSFINI